VAGLEAMVDVHGPPDQALDRVFGKRIIVAGAPQVAQVALGPSSADAMHLRASGSAYDPARRRGAQDRAVRAVA
jgi:uncharacterized protein with ACT and thioredoxin-like domain